MNARPILIGVGANVDPERNVRAAWRRLRRHWPGLRASTFYWTRPIGGRRPQPPYLNGVFAAEAADGPAAVRAVLAAAERAAGRVRDPADRCAPRPLDLDLLLYGDLVDPAENLPAAELLERDFVLLPAAELLPAFQHPAARAALRELAQARFPRPVTILRPATTLSAVRRRPRGGR
jgi:2-amino-4-hydroxy-6-hydroxymethyldihydropteridine diphosphokinase